MYIIPFFLPYTIFSADILHPLGEMWLSSDEKLKTFSHLEHILVPYFSLFRL